MIPNCELVKVDGIQFLVFKGSDLISNHLKQELYENNIHQLSLKLLMDAPEGEVLDIGANLGTFCVPLAKKVSKHIYHAFEPQRIVYYQLCANTFINGLDNLHCHNFGILIKVDVEGHELEVIKGGIETIKASNYPPIIFEAWTWKPWFQEKRTTLFEYLKGHGYEITELGQNNLATHESHK
jgi:hypothetical protein